VVREAAAIIKLYRDLRGYPEAAGDPLYKLMDRYVDQVIGPGWDWQKRGEANPTEITIMSEFHRLVSAFRPADSAEGIRHAETLRALDAFVEARRIRISAGSNAIPKIMWIIVLVGAIMNVMVIWMFDLKPFTHAVIGGSLSAFVGLVIYMIAWLDAPFRGADGLKPEAIAAVHTQIGLHKRE
jgi:hypothetical protein